MWTKEDLADRCIPVAESGCWLWTRSCRTNGYGQWYLPDEKIIAQAHRVSWMIFNGAIPDGLLVCHRCDVRCCVNPSHLFLGTHSDNFQDEVRKGRHPLANKVACPQGHPYNEENTKWYEGRRYCRACGKVYCREHMRRKRARFKAAQQVMQ